MSAQHTPGPWAVSKSKARRVVGPHGIMICNAVLRNQGGPKAKLHIKDEHEAEANAHLIAAAPDMLKALREAKSLADMAAMSDDPDGTASDDQDALVRLRAKINAAIAKGTGK